MNTNEKSHAVNVANSPLVYKKNAHKSTENSGLSQSQAAIGSILNPENILRGIEDVVSSFKRPEHHEILAQILQRTGKIDFRHKARLKEGENLTHGHYLVYSIEEVINTAQTMQIELCQYNGNIYLYNGAWFKATDSGEFKYFLFQAALKMGVVDVKAKVYQFHDHLLKQFLSTAHLPKPEPTDGVTLLNLQNGTLEITQQGRTLRDFSYKDFLTYQLPFAYDKEATAPQFLKFIHRVLPDEASRKVLAEYLGYIFIHDLKLEKVPLLYGHGANGKSVFFDVINALLGSENLSSYSLRNLTDENGYYRAMIGDKLLNYASELDVSFNNDEFKKMVSGEPLSARPPYKEPILLKRYAKLMFNCNELPPNAEQTEAYFRRLLIIPFNVTIPENERDPELAKKIIKSELAGVFNWVLEGLERVLKQKGFTECKVISEQLQEYKRVSDSVQVFLSDENYQKDTQATIPLKTLYSEYKAYCFENNNKPVANRKFSERLKRIGYEVERKNDGNVVFINKKTDSTF